MYEGEADARTNYPMKLAVDNYRPTLTERLKNEREDLAKRLAELDAAITALDANPQVQQVLDLVQKVARY